MRTLILGYQDKISHYVINDIIFINYMDAFEFCINHKIDTNLIIKTKKYI